MRTFVAWASYKLIEICSQTPDRQGKGRLRPRRDHYSMPIPSCDSQRQACELFLELLLGEMTTVRGTQASLYYQSKVRGVSYETENEPEKVCLR